MSTGELSSSTGDGSSGASSSSSSSTGTIVTTVTSSSDDDARNQLILIASCAGLAFVVLVLCAVAWWCRGRNAAEERAAQELRRKLQADALAARQAAKGPSLAAQRDAEMAALSSTSAPSNPGAAAIKASSAAASAERARIAREKLQAAAAYTEDLKAAPLVQESSVVRDDDGAEEEEIELGGVHLHSMHTNKSAGPGAAGSGARPPPALRVTSTSSVAPPGQTPLFALRPMAAPGSPPARR